MRRRWALTLAAAAAALGSTTIGSGAPSAAALVAMPVTSGGVVSAPPGARYHESGGSGPAAPASRGLWRPKHVVIVLEENHGPSQIIGSRAAPYMNQLATTGASMTNSFSETHPSQPNYLALFSGSTHGLTNDSCPHYFASANLGSELRSAGLTLSGYADSMPGVGYTGCTIGKYARKHNPVVDFSNLPASVNQPFTAFPRSYTSLPTVSFVVPNLLHDMHDGTIAAADSWLKQNLGPYVTWAKAHNSVLILTWDEGGKVVNQIPTIMAGAHVKAGNYGEHIDHYSVLRTIEDMYGLGHLGYSAQRSPITDIWR